MIHTVTLNPAVDKTIVVDDLRVGAVNRATSVRQDPGGKGVNVSKTIRALGGESSAFALLGGPTGAFVTTSLEQMGIAVRAFAAPGATRTNTKLVDPTRGTFTDINEPGPTVTPELLDRALAEFASALAPEDVVVLAGSLPAGAPAGTYATWVTACLAAGAQVFLDADGEAMALGIQAGPSLVKPNDVELARLVGRPLAGDAEVVAAARELVAQGVAEVMVSLGGDGAVYVSPEGAWRLRQPTVEVLSTVGAGDSVVASLAYAKAEGLPLADALALSMAVGAATVSRPGTEPARLEDVSRLLPQVTVAPLPY